MNEDQQTNNEGSEQLTTAPGVDDLSDVRRQAFEALGPVLEDLDVEPERKFDIIIDALRLTGDKNLANTALRTAIAIQAPGTKAEALVQLINEIDYLQSQ